MLDLNKKFSLNEKIVLRSIADKYWALDTLNGNQYRLNESAFFILDHLRTLQSIAQLIDKILNNYDINQEQLITDCRAILQSAKEKGIIKEVS